MCKTTVTPSFYTVLFDSLLPQESQQVFGQPLFVGGEQAMGCAFVFDQIGLGNAFGGKSAGGLYRNDVVIGAVDDECWHLER